jgi:hypothetical protein
MMRIFLKKFVLTLFPMLLCTVNSAWAICEAEAESKIDAIFELERPRPRSLAVSRVQKETDNSHEFMRGLSQSERLKLREKWISWLEASRRDNSSLIVRKNFETATLSHNLCLLASYTGSSGSTANVQEQSNRLTQPQETSQSAQQQSQQAQQSAQQTQARADQQRQGKRKTHDPAAEAHECISIDKSGSGNFGAFKNQCPYPVNFYSCNEKPRIIQGGFNWSADFDCAKPSLGLYTPKGNSSVAAHNRNTEFVHWYACKAPAMPADATYTPGKGIEARCHN